jgi:hypothetical protein
MQRRRSTTPHPQRIIILRRRSTGAAGMAEAIITDDPIGSIVLRIFLSPAAVGEMHSKDDRHHDAEPQQAKHAKDDEFLKTDVEQG